MLKQKETRNKQLDTSDKVFFRTFAAEISKNKI